jgi:hypothetical protein
MLTFAGNEMKLGLSEEKIMKSLIAFAVVMLSIGSAYAGDNPTAVPEIEGTAGLAAMGAVGAVVAFFWERRRMRKN